MALNYIIVLINLALFAAIPILLGVYVYRDATKRGMNAALWTVVAVLAPAFVGFIIYLLVRSSHSDLQCPQCKNTVEEHFVVCPKCGVRLKASCTGCGLPVEPDWTVCPKCTAALTPHRDGFNPPVRKKDKALGKILLAVILIPILLIILIAVFSFSRFSASAMMGSSSLSADDYANHPEVTAWLDRCNASPDLVYALRYETDSAGQIATHYLVYNAASGTSGNTVETRATGLFGANVEVRFRTDSGGSEAGGKLAAVSYYAEKSAELKVYVNGKKTDCEITEVSFNPTLFELGAWEEPLLGAPAAEN